MALNFTDIGSGKPLVLIHGYPLDRSIWQKQEVLQNHFRLIIPDLPGFGLSPAQNFISLENYADAIIAIQDTLGLPKTTVIGHSMGGYIALAMLEKYPERLNGIGLINSQAGSDSEPAREGRFTVIKRVENEGPGFIGGVMLEKLFAAEAPEELKAQVTEIMKRASGDGVTAALRSMADRPDRLHLLQNPSIPLLVIAGKADRLIPPEKAESIKAACPKSHYYVLNGAGHMAMLERSVDVNNALLEFVGSL